MNSKSNSPKSNLNGHIQHLYRLKHIHLQLAQRSRFFFFFFNGTTNLEPTSQVNVHRRRQEKSSRPSKNVRKFKAIALVFRPKNKRRVLFCKANAVVLVSSYK
jgi:hypothetical protein